MIGAGRCVLSAGSAPAALESAVRKLENLVFRDVDQMLTIDLSEPPLLDELRGAIETNSVVRIQYTAIGTGEKTTRDI